MATKTKTALVVPNQDRYLELVLKFPLRPLLNDKELDRPIEVVDSLISRGELEQEEQDYLDVLAAIVERYETAEHPMPNVADAAMLRHLIDGRGVKQSKLAAETRIQMSTISEVLNGKRRLNRNHIAALSKYFDVSPAVFEP